jgi:hypothetical protein
MEKIFGGLAAKQSKSLKKHGAASPPKIFSIYTSFYPGSMSP